MKQQTEIKHFKEEYRFFMERAGTHAATEDVFIISSKLTANTYLFFMCKIKGIKTNTRGREMRA